MLGSSTDGLRVGKPDGKDQSEGLGLVEGGDINILNG
jgi:hypothetical protein